VLVPPQAYVGMLTNSSAGRSWWAQYAYFWTHWGDPEGYAGAWTPAHLWFILFLLVYSFLALALFVWLRGASGGRVIGRFASACRRPGVVIVVPTLLLLSEKALVPMDDLSGQTPVGFFLLFMLGFVLVADDRITEAVDGSWQWALPLGVAAMAVRAGLWPSIDRYADGSWQDTTVNWLLYQLGVWMMIIGLLGLSHRYASRANRCYRYATEGAYPFYVLHQTVIVLLAYWIVRWNIGIPAAYTLIALAALGVTLLAYDVAVRRWQPARFLFGMKDRNP
jgi:glucan biosynthesis protein C